MLKQVYYEDVQIGQEIPRLSERFDSRRLVMWAAASGDFYQIHYDKDFAQGTGLDDRIVHGALKHALLGRMLHEWIGNGGRIAHFTCQYRGMDPVDSDIISRGRITDKFLRERKMYVKLEIWTEDSNGQVKSPGSALVTLPSRS